ncbi:hypothetical protein A9C11_18295 [Pseudomonas citronellolis]|uniref:Uncharacterized protein n=1 Tax=Pseudomonas citronellolis TaxID=53408 RepID=A0A1A9KE77_9PSED|nr:hypothetical protein [Pseudomonas citronellolis]ANI15799.1 hypothetical protein A9C11_18295 [Pseudomonas citronellolis]
MAVELQLQAQVRLVLLQVARLGMGEQIAPGQVLAGQPAAQRGDGRHAALYQEAPGAAQAAGVHPVQAGVALLQQQARRQQRAEARAVLQQQVQRLLQVASQGQGAARRTSANPNSAPPP